MRYKDFIKELNNAGWCDIARRDYKRIKRLHAKLFPVIAEMEMEIEHKEMSELKVLQEIRSAIGDEGQLMQSELVAKISEMQQELDSTDAKVKRVRKAQDL